MGYVFYGSVFDLLLFSIHCLWMTCCSLRKGFALLSISSVFSTPIHLPFTKTLIPYRKESRTRKYSKYTKTQASEQNEQTENTVGIKVNASPNLLYRSDQLRYLSQKTKKRRYNSTSSKKCALNQWLTGNSDSKKKSTYSSSSSSSPNGCSSATCAKNSFNSTSNSFLMLYMLPAPHISLHPHIIRVDKLERNLPVGTINCPPFPTLNSSSPTFTLALPLTT